MGGGGPPGSQRPPPKNNTTHLPVHTHTDERAVLRGRVKMTKANLALFFLSREGRVYTLFLDIQYQSLI